jgi:carboxypeptidase C (cathepsin A)
MFSLDQPTEVAFSYSSDASTINTSPAAAKDVYAFLQLFVSKHKNLYGSQFWRAMVERMLLILERSFTRIAKA